MINNRMDFILLNLHVIQLHRKNELNHIMYVKRFYMTIYTFKSKCLVHNQ